MKHFSDQDRTWFCLLYLKYAHLDHVSKDSSCRVGIFLARWAPQRQPDNLFISHCQMLQKQRIRASATADGENSRLSPGPVLLHLHFCSLSCLSVVSSVVMPFPLCLILVWPFSLPWPACSKLLVNGMETMLQNVLQIRWASIRELQWSRKAMAVVRVWKQTHSENRGFASPLSFLSS